MGPDDAAEGVSAGAVVSEEAAATQAPTGVNVGAAWRSADREN